MTEPCDYSTTTELMLINVPRAIAALSAMVSICALIYLGEKMYAYWGTTIQVTDAHQAAVLDFAATAFYTSVSFTLLSVLLNGLAYHKNPQRFYQECAISVIVPLVAVFIPLL